MFVCWSMRGVWEVVRLLTLFWIWGILRLWHTFFLNSCPSKATHFLQCSTKFSHICRRQFCDILRRSLVVVCTISDLEPNFYPCSSCLRLGNTQTSQRVRSGLWDRCSADVCECWCQPLCSGSSQLHVCHSDPWWQPHHAWSWRQCCRKKTNKSWNNKYIVTNYKHST